MAFSILLKSVNAHTILFEPTLVHSICMNALLYYDYINTATWFTLIACLVHTIRDYVLNRRNPVVTDHYVYPTMNVHHACVVFLCVYQIIYPTDGAKTILAMESNLCLHMLVRIFKSKESRFAIHPVALEMLAGADVAVWIVMRICYPLLYLIECRVLFAIVPLAVLIGMQVYFLYLIVEAWTEDFLNE